MYPTLGSEDNFRFLLLGFFSAFVEGFDEEEEEARVDAREGSDNIACCFLSSSRLRDSRSLAIVSRGERGESSSHRDCQSGLAS